jgi:predicted glycosyltransferase involved in capsule biosynthesis
MLQYSIIIPHRKREKNLNACLQRLEDVMPPFWDEDVEAVVVNERADGDLELPDRQLLHVRVINVDRTGELFNKPRLQNIGINESTGRILTFLDADALVGDRFFHAASIATSRRLTKVCYRVRRLPEDFAETMENDSHALRIAFDHYEEYPEMHEAYGSAHLWMFNGWPVFGNSQFTIERVKLGGLRFNEEYEGAGYEDIWMNREIHRQYGKRYQALIFTDADHAMFHIANRRENDWWEPEANVRNRERYKNS